jgi:C4-dicarboxylate-specific signal transduction histidine kinase
MLALRNWSLTTKVVSLCMGTSLVLAVSVTAVGYAHASRGLDEQGQARLQSDAFVVAQTVDRWNAQPLSVAHAVARFPAVVRALEAGDARSPEDVTAVYDLINSLTQGMEDLPSLTILDAKGTSIFGLNPATIGNNYTNRDYFQNAVKGRDFISGGVTAAERRNACDLSRYASAQRRRAHHRRGEREE